MTDPMDLSEPVALEPIDGIILEPDTPETETRDETIERLSRCSKLDYEAARKTEARRLGFRVDILDDAVERAKFERMHAEAAAAQPHAEAMAAQQQVEVEAALADTAAEIIACDDVLGLFEADWRRLVAGEEKNAKILYLVATSRLLKKTMHAAVKGPSSAGKSEIRSRVLGFMPPESVISFTSLSERALIYNQDDFEHKILSMGEAAGAQEQSLQDYLLRELMSEGRLEYHTVQKVGNVMETIVIVKDGPVAFMVTTTKSKLHPENETRMLSLDVDDSEAQTRAVLAKVAEVEGLGAVSADVDFEPWHAFQRWLAAGTAKVVVPYAAALADAIPPRSVRLRRDLGQVLRAIMAHALLHRAHRDLDERGRIVADIDHDYAAVRDLVHGLLQETAEVAIKVTTLETIDAVKQATAGMGLEDGAACQAIAKMLRIDRSAAYRRLRVAQDGGHVANIESRKGRPAQYRATDQEVTAEVMLPTAEALERKFASTPPQTHRTPAHISKRPEEVTSYPVQGALHRSPAGVHSAQPVQGMCKPLCTGQSTENVEENGELCACAENPEELLEKTTDPEQVDVEETIAEAVDHDGDRDEREAIMAVDGLDIPAFLKRT